MNTKESGRPKLTDPHLEEREREWWETFAVAEDRFAWVQTPTIQRILHGHYVSEIVCAAGAKGSILELGCGTGWLSLVLASMGAGRVTGVDFSPAQIAIAKQRARESRFGRQVEFIYTQGAQDGAMPEQYDCVVVHAFLHHLNETELIRTLTCIPRYLKPGGVFIVFEPVRRGCRDASKPQGKWEKRLTLLRRLANSGQRLGFRRISSQEQYWRDLLSRRDWGQFPLGPSPKEMPFQAGELEQYLEKDFVVQRQSPAMSMSHAVVQEWLLRAESHPRSTSIALPMVAKLARRWDERLLGSGELPDDFWAFTLFICRALSAQ